MFVIMTDQEFDRLKQEERANKKLIKEAGFKVVTVKRQYRLLDSKSNRLAERNTFFCTFDTFREFADIVKKAVNV